MIVNVMYTYCRFKSNFAVVHHIIGAYTVVSYYTFGGVFITVFVCPLYKVTLPSQKCKLMEVCCRYYHSIMDDGQALNYSYQNGSKPSTDSIQALVANLAYTLALTLCFHINSTGPCDELEVPERDTYAELVRQAS